MSEAEIIELHEITDSMEDSLVEIECALREIASLNQTFDHPFYATPLYGS